MDIIGSVSYAVMQVVHFSVVCLCEDRLNRETGLFSKKIHSPVKGNVFWKRLLPCLSGTTFAAHQQGREAQQAQRGRTGFRYGQAGEGQAAVIVGDAVPEQVLAVLREREQCIPVNVAGQGSAFSQRDQVNRQGGSEVQHQVAAQVKRQAAGHVEGGCSLHVNQRRVEAGDVQRGVVQRGGGGAGKRQHLSRGDHGSAGGVPQNHRGVVDGGIPRQADGEVLGSGNAAQVLDGSRLERDGVGQRLAVGVERSSLYQHGTLAKGGRGVGLERSLDDGGASRVSVIAGENNRGAVLVNLHAYLVGSVLVGNDGGDGEVVASAGTVGNQQFSFTSDGSAQIGGIPVKGTGDGYPGSCGVNGNVCIKRGSCTEGFAVKHFKRGTGFHQHVRRAAQHGAYPVQAQLGVLPDGDGFKRIGSVSGSQIDRAGVNDQVRDVGGMVGVDGAGAVRYFADRQGAVRMGNGDQRPAFKGVFHVPGSRQGEGGGFVRPGVIGIIAGRRHGQGTCEGPVGVGGRDEGVFPQRQGTRIDGSAVSRDGDGGIVPQGQVSGTGKARQAVGPVHDDGAGPVKGGVSGDVGRHGQRGSFRGAENAGAGQVQASAGNGQVAPGQEDGVRTAGLVIRNRQCGRAVGDVDGSIGSCSFSSVRPCGISQLGCRPLGGSRSIQGGGDLNAVISIDDLDACNAAAGSCPAGIGWRSDAQVGGSLAVHVQGVGSFHRLSQGSRCSPCPGAGHGGGAVPRIGNAVDGFGGEVCVGCVRIAVNVNAVGQEIHAADVDGDPIAVIQISFEHLAVPGAGGAPPGPCVFTGPRDGCSGGVSVVVFQVLGRGLGSSAELVPVGSKDRVKTRSGGIRDSAV